MVSVAEPCARSRAAGVWARLAKTRAIVTRGLHAVFADGAEAKAATWLDELHDQLILADVGVVASARIIKQLQQTSRRARLPN